MCAQWQHFVSCKWKFIAFNYSANIRWGDSFWTMRFRVAGNGSAICVQSSHVSHFKRTVAFLLPKSVRNIFEGQRTFNSLKQWISESIRVKSACEMATCNVRSKMIQLFVCINSKHHRRQYRVARACIPFSRCQIILNAIPLHMSYEVRRIDERYSQISFSQFVWIFAPNQTSVMKGERFCRRRRLRKSFSQFFSASFFVFILSFFLSSTISVCCSGGRLRPRSEKKYNKCHNNIDVEQLQISRRFSLRTAHSIFGLHWCLRRRRQDCLYYTRTRRAL